MKTSLLAIIFALVALQRETPPQETLLDSEHCKCSIEVTIKRGGTGEPMPNTAVQLRAAFRGGPPSVQTDDSGRAVFRDLAEGVYTVVAQRQGTSFIDKSAQSTVYVGPREQFVQQVSLNLITGGSLSGRVLDANRQPAHTAISAYRVEYRNGQRSLEVAGVVEETSKLGEYRLSQLPEGEYYIRTISVLPQQNQTYY